MSTIPSRRGFSASRGSTLIATALVNISGAAGRVLPLALGSKVSEPAADVVCRLAADKRAHATANFAQVLGRSQNDPVVRRTARGSFRHFGRFVAESIHAQSWGTASFLDRVDVEGEANLDTARRYGLGVIFVSAHMGATEIGGAYAVLKGFRVTSVMEAVRPQWLQECVLISRRRMGISLIPPPGAGLSLIRELRRGGMVAFAVDAGIERPDSLPVQFFGRNTPFPEGPSRLARMTGAPIVFAVTARTGPGRYRIYIEPPTLSDRESGSEDDIRQMTQRMASTLERFVRRYPSQWYAFRDMWPGSPRTG